METLLPLAVHLSMDGAVVAEEDCLTGTKGFVRILATALSPTNNTPVVYYYSFPSPALPLIYDSQASLAYYYQRLSLNGEPSLGGVKASPGDC